MPSRAVSLALRQPEQIGRMEIAQHPGRRRLDGWVQQLAPERPERAAFGVRDRCVEPRQEPVHQELGFDQERVHVVGRNAVFDMGRDGQGVGQPLLVQRKQHVDRGLVALLDRRRRIAAHHALLAEVLEDQQSVIEISVMDDGRREAVLPQAVRHRHERHDTVGKMRDRAIGLAAAHRRAVRPARHVHQDHVLVAEGEPLVRRAWRRRPASARAAPRHSRSRR